MLKPEETTIGILPSTEIYASKVVLAPPVVPLHPAMMTTTMTTPRVQAQTKH